MQWIPPNTALTCYFPPHSEPALRSGTCPLLPGPLKQLWAGSLPPGPLSQSFGANPGTPSDEIPVTASQQPPSWVYEVFFISAAHCLSPTVRSPSKEAPSPFLECALSSLFAHASHRLDSSLGPSHPQVFANIFLKPL